jgi:hypothetical protein
LESLGALKLTDGGKSLLSRFFAPHPFLSGKKQNMASNWCSADSYIHYIQEVIINREKSKRQSRIFFKMLLRE